MDASAVIEAMRACGHSDGEILAVVEKLSEKRALTGAERTRRWRERNKVNEKSPNGDSTIYGVKNKEWQIIRKKIFQRDGFKCVYCGSDGNGNSLHCDHVIPWSGGGKTTDDNLVTACRTCNTSKNSRSLNEWMAL